MKRVLPAIALAVVAVATLPAAASASVGVRGVVVSRSHGSLLVATRSGRLVEIKGHAALGSRVVGDHIVGHARRARIHGVVVKEMGGKMLLASNHHLVAIHRNGRGLAGTNSTAGPAPGTIVTATVSVNSDTGQLNEDDQGEDGQDSSSAITIQATVTAVGPGTVTVSVNGTDVTFDLPAGLTLPQSLVGQTVMITIAIDQGDDNSQGDEP